MKDKDTTAADINKLTAYCLRKNGAYEDYPFGPEPQTIKVKNKIFAIFYNADNGWKLTLKCVPAFGDFMKQMYPGVVTRGYHFPPVSPLFHHDRYARSNSAPRVVFDDRPCLWHGGRETIKKVAAGIAERCAVKHRQLR